MSLNVRDNKLGEGVEPALCHDWHACDAAMVVSQLNSQTAGLAHDEVSLRLQQYGENKIKRQSTSSVWQRLFRQFHNVLIYVLIGAGLVTLWLQHWVDSAVIFGVVVLNALIGFVQEGKAEKALDAIRSMLSHKATVRRAGDVVMVAADQLVPGDIVLLQAGDKVPADLRLLQAKQLRIDESLLTGESVAVDKKTTSMAVDALLGERFCMAYSGTMVTYGQGVGVVVATGDDTELGRIGGLLEGVTTLSTPLVRKMAVFAQKLTYIILALALITFVFGLWVHDFSQAEMFLAAVGLVVAAIPEGLPAIMTIALAVGVKAMAQRHAIIRRLPVVEALGSVTVVCTDKTGTLTRNEMTVKTVLLASKQIQVAGEGYDPHGQFAIDHAYFDVDQEADLQALILAAALCNDARVFQNDLGEWQLIGDPTEGALYTLALKAGCDIALQLKERPRSDVIPFESERKYMATLHHDHAGHGFIYVKGAPEQLLSMCTHQRLQGDDVLLNPAHWLQRVNDIAAQGQRVIALAYKVSDAGFHSLQHSELESGLTLLGMVGMMDPPRQEAIEAVAQCQAAGIRVMMITGDHALTASAIAKSINVRNSEHVYTGQTLDALSDEAFADCARQASVFARTTPKHKLKLVQALQAQGEIVAMTGDGVNDAPALRRADVGIAMGHKGTEVSKEAAEVVLVDDNFASIHNAIEEGRVVYDNIKKAILYTLPTSVGEALAIMAAILFGIALPITPVQILWVNMVTAVTLALALAFEPAEENIMQRPPRKPDAPLLSRHLVWRVMFVAVIMVIGTFGLYFMQIAQGQSLEYARTVAVNTLVMFEIFYLFNARYLSQSSCKWSVLFSNQYVIWAISALLCMQWMFTYWSPAQLLFGTTAITPLSWLQIVVVASSVFVLVELEKYWLRRRGVLEF